MNKNMNKNTVKNTSVAATGVAATIYDTLPNRLLTPHFSLREMIVSATAIRHGLDNTPTADVEQRLKQLCVNVLEPLRCRFGAIRITSGYRSPKVNSLVGGAATSQHQLGEAADLHAGSEEVARKMYEYILHNLDFDQLILEYRPKTATRWIHVSYTTRRPCRHEAFEKRLR